MERFFFLVNLLGTTGGIVFLLFLLFDSIVYLNNWWVQYRLARDMNRVCAEFGLTIDKLEITDKTITGILRQGELEHGFRVEYTGRYKPLAAESLVRAVGAAAHFDVPEHPEA